MMPESNEDDISPTERSESRLSLRFVAARPDSNKARREARAAIRAHASQASWANIKQKGRRSRQDQHNRPTAASGSVSTRLVPSSNDQPDDDDDFRRTGSSSSQRIGTVRQTVFASVSVPNPLRTVGAGDADPFTSYPSRLPKEIAGLLDSKVTDDLENLFLPDPHQSEQGVTQVWRSWFRNNSLVFHALCLSQLSRLKGVGAGMTAIDRKAYWFCYSEVVRGVNERFNDASTRCQDDTLFAIIVLAFGEVANDDPDLYTPRSPAQGPMNAMQGLDLYSGRFKPVSVHVNGLLRMLSLRGGINELHFPGLAAMFSYGDLILASRSLWKPSMPYIPFMPIGETPQHLPSALNREGHPLAQLGSGFQILHDLLPAEQAQKLFLTLHNLAAYSLAVDDYIMGGPQAQSLRVLADQRNYVQHFLLSMSSITNDTLEDEPNLLQQACWAAGTVYSLISVFPVPHHSAPFSKLARMIKQHLTSTSTRDSIRWQRPSPLTLWIIVMGTLASTASDDGREERVWYMTVLERLVHRMEIPSWQSLKDQLLKFLWFPSTSDADGQHLWREIHTSNPFR